MLRPEICAPRRLNLPDAALVTGFAPVPVGIR